METYLPLIQATLAEWLQLTLDHPLYAAALVIGVWLLTAILYSIRIAGLNKKNRLSEQARTSAETTLTTTQQQLQQAQDELVATTEQHQQLVETEKQRATTAELQLAQRNQDIAATVQSLASNFDIGERPLTVPENLKADDLWQQHDKVIKQLIERLRTEQQAKTELEKFYQAEKTKLAETDAKLVSLQANLDSQTSLVLALQTQTTTLQQQQNDTQRDLTEALKKHQADLARLLQLEQQASQFTHIQPQNVAPIAPVAPTPVVQPINDVTIEEPVQSLSVAVDEATAKMQDLFKKSPEPATPEIEVTTASVQAIEQPEIKPESPVIAPELVAIVEPVAETPEKTGKVSALKGMYQKFTTSKAAQAESAPAVSVIEPAPEIKVDAVAEAPEKSSKESALKGLYQKFATSKTESVEPAPVVSAVEPEPIVVAVIEPEPVPEIKVQAVAEAPEKPSKGSALKGLYQKYTTAKVQEKDLAPESFDNVSSSLEDKADQITEKLEQLKGVYGKFFSKKDK